MRPYELEIFLVGGLVALTTALPGAFLVLRRMALLSDAISHSILLGIVLAFFVVGDLASPFLILAAAATGVLTVALVQALESTHRVREDAAIALVFPVLFSIAVILIARHAGQVHLDVDAVLLGELAFAPLKRMTLGGRDAGPTALWVLGGILLLNLGFLTLLYKEMKLSTFDAGLAAALGFSPLLLQYAFMSVVSITVVGAFDAVGSILVVALMIAPAAAARLLTDRLLPLVALSAALGLFSALLGIRLALWFDTSLAGSMAVVVGGVFLLVLLLAPDRGVVAELLRRRRQRLEFSGQMLLIHLLNHEATPLADEENRLDHLSEHLRWTPEFALRVARHTEREGLSLREPSGGLHLTPLGREVARDSMLR